mgnify:CR=1 FL=1
MLVNSIIIKKTYFLIYDHIFDDHIFEDGQ